jgi:hypothetical protein
MMIVGTQLITEVDDNGLTVEFVDDRGNVVSVRLTGSGATRQTAVSEAKRLLERLVASGTLPDRLHDAKNQDGRAATLASSEPVAQTATGTEDADGCAEDDVAHGRRVPGSRPSAAESDAGSHPMSSLNGVGGASSLVNPDATPGTGMLPNADDSDENMQPSS